MRYQCANGMESGSHWEVSADTCGWRGWLICKTSIVFLVGVLSHLQKQSYHCVIDATLMCGQQMFGNGRPNRTGGTYQFKALRSCLKAPAGACHPV